MTSLEAHIKTSSPDHYGKMVSNKIAYFRRSQSHLSIMTMPTNGRISIKLDIYTNLKLWTQHANVYVFLRIHLSTIMTIFSLFFKLLVLGNLALFNSFNISLKTLWTCAIRWSYQYLVFPRTSLVGCKTALNLMDSMVTLKQ